MQTLFLRQSLGNVDLLKQILKALVFETSFIVSRQEADIGKVAVEISKDAFYQNREKNSDLALSQISLKTAFFDYNVGVFQLLIH